MADGEGSCTSGTPADLMGAMARSRRWLLEAGELDGQGSGPCCCAAALAHLAVMDGAGGERVAPAAPGQMPPPPLAELGPLEGLKYPLPGWKMPLSICSAAGPGGGPAWCS